MAVDPGLTSVGVSCTGLGAEGRAEGAPRSRLVGAGLVGTGIKVAGKPKVLTVGTSVGNIVGPVGKIPQ